MSDLPCHQQSDSSQLASVEPGTSNVPVDENQVCTIPSLEYINDSVIVHPTWSSDPRSALSNRSTFHSLRKRDPTGGVCDATSVYRMTYLILIFSYVLANDLSPAACEAMKRNVEINGLASSDPDSAKVQVNEGDAW